MQLLEPRTDRGDAVACVLGCVLQQYSVVRFCKSVPMYGWDACRVLQPYRTSVAGHA